MCTSKPASPAEVDQPDYKLPTTVVPSHYVIHKTPNFRDFTFAGDVGIDIEVREEVGGITLHARDLMLTSAFVEHENGTRLNAILVPATVVFIDPTTGKPTEKSFSSAASLDVDSERATFNFGGKLGKGAWKLHATYVASMVQPSLEGLYRSKWVDDQGVDHWMASTQLAATQARRAFPCFDEPALKATYEISLSVPEHMTALANAAVVGTKIESAGLKLVRFAATPKMSTYLVAYAIGEFESSEPVQVRGKELRIWSTPGKNHLKSFALKCAAFGVKWFEEFFGRPYFGGDKIDMIAIPEFRFGAMENTGLITYRATALLVDEKTGTTREKKRVAEVVLHELDHQWNGNEVTMAWWDGLGLNESFATIMAYIAMNDLEPAWEVFNDFGIDRAGAFALDSLKNTHPVFAAVGHPDEVEQRFDSITYEKGGSLLFQIIQFIGLDVFRSGMRIYMERHALGNTEVTDLWDALEEGCREHGLTTPVRRIMDAWMLTAGHPVLTVTETDTPGLISFKQELFQFLPDGESNVVFPIPVHIRYQTADGQVKEEKHLVDSREQSLQIDPGFSYLVVNASGPGFYRVRYSKALLEKVTANPLATLQVIERFNLVNDSWAMVRAQLLDADTYLTLVRKFGAERNPNVWSVIGNSLEHLFTLTAGDRRKQFRALVKSLVKPVFVELGWAPKPGESAATLQLRGQLADLLGTIGGDYKVRGKAAKLFAEWRKDSASVDPNVVPALVSILAYTGGLQRFEEFVAIARNAKTDQERLRFLRSLGLFQKPKLYKAAMYLILAEVKTDDAPGLLAGIISTEHAGVATWDFMRENWQVITEKFPTRGVVDMVDSCSSLDTPELQAQVLEFFSKNEVRQGDVALAQMIERLTVNVRLRESETPKVESHLVALATGGGASL
ncbi:M1 family metallopeptidase [soil metagenome]